jgi:acylphosphatase
MSAVIKRAVFRGRVQGVGFRDFVQRQANRAAIEGWVRNRADGSVEAVFSGEQEQVAAVIAACERGPRSGRVDSVDVTAAGAGDLGLRPAGAAFAVLATL